MKNTILVVAALTFSLPVLAADYEGKIYEKDSNKQKQLFTVKHHETLANGKVVKTRREFLDMSGKPVVIEEIDFDDKIPFKKFTLQMLQVNEQGSLEFKDGKSHFSYTKDGKTETDDEDFSPNLVIGGTVVPHLQKNWQTILKGDDVNVRFAALDRKETVGFKFFKIADVKFEGKDAIQVKMKPTSIVIAAIVDPLIFTFSKDGSQLYELVGRTSPKVQKDGKWKDLDADIVYTYAPEKSAAK